jgi:host factor-I protein
VERAVETGNRKLIRPSLNEVKDQMNRRPPNNHQKKVAPPDQTNAENFYYMKQMQAKTPMVFVIKDVET